MGTGDWGLAAFHDALKLWTAEFTELPG